MTDFRRVAMAVGTTAAMLGVGVAAGVLAERTLVARTHRADSEADEPFGRLRGTPVMVTDSFGGQIYAEVEECTRTDPQNLTLVFCHGYALNQDTWHYQRRDLRAQGRLVFWDQRSHGRSARSLAETNTIDQEGDDLFHVITQLVPEGPIVLVGHSMGGMAIQAFALAHPELFATRVRGVALLSTSTGGLADVPLGMPETVAKVAHRYLPRAVGYAVRNADLIEHGRARVSDLVLYLTRRYSYGPDVSPALNDFTHRMIGGTPIDVIAEFLPTLEEHDRSGALEILARVPGLVMVGTDDLLTPAEHSERIAEALPLAEFEVIPDTGHMMLLEHYAQVNHRLRRLIARVRADLVGDPAAPAAAPAGA